MTKNLKSGHLNLINQRSYFRGLIIWSVTLVWYVITIGGEWFLMWQSKNWNGQNNAFLLCICFLLFLIDLNQHDN